MDENNDDMEFDKNSELGKLFEMLRKAQQEQRNDYGGDLSDPEVLKNMMDDLTENQEPVNVENITKDGLTFVIKEFLVDDKLFKTFEVYGDEDKVDFENLEDTIREVINTKDSDANKTIIDINRDAKPKSNKPLKEQLELAVKEEHYELAIELRDKIQERDERMAPLIKEINEALANEEIERSEELLKELKKINNEYT